MSDYINKDAFVKDITERYCSGCDDRFGTKCIACWVEDMLDEIDDAPTEDAVIIHAPTVDAEPVRYGHWVEMERGHYFKCSECRNPIPYKFGWKFYNGVVENNRYYNFCPNCGADMRKENA